MPTVKLCAYSRGFYPTVWGSKLHTVFGAFLVIVDGKLKKRSFRECAIYNLEDHAETEAFATGLGWIISNLDNLRDTNLQVFFCGAARQRIKARIDNNKYFPDRTETPGMFVVEDPCTFFGYDERVLKMFNKVTYHIAARVTINDGEDDDPENAETFDLYAAMSKYFKLLYGDDINPGHTIHEFLPGGQTHSDRVELVGMPEIRWGSGAAKTDQWT